MPAKYPDLKLDWRRMKLGEICDIFIGSRPGRYRSVERGGVLSIGGEHIGQDGTVKLDTPKYISREFYQSMREGHIRKYDILMVKIGATAGKSAWWDKDHSQLKAAVNNNVFIFRVNVLDDVMPYYVFQYLNSSWGRKGINKCENESTIEHLDTSAIASMFLPIPPISHQRKIANILSTWDKAINKTRALIKAKEKKFKYLLYHLITDNKDMLNWHRVKLGEVFDISPGVDHLPAIRKEEEFQEGDVLSIGVKNVAEDGFVVLNPRKYISRKFYEEVGKRGQIREHDILLVKDAGIGKSAYWSRDYSQLEAAVSERVFIFRIKIPAEVIPYYVFQYLNTLGGKKEVKKCEHKGTIGHLAKSAIANITFSTPPLSQQKTIAAILYKAQQEIKLLKELHTKYQIQKRGLMQRLLNGEADGE